MSYLTTKGCFSTKGDPFTHNPSVLTDHRWRCRSRSRIFNDAGLSIAKQQTDEMLDLFLTREGSGGGRDHTAGNQNICRT